MGTLKNVRKKLLKKHGFRKAFYEGQWDIGMETGMLIEYTRIKKGITQEQLAKKMNTKQSAISRAERNYVPSLTFLNNVAKALGCKLQIKFVKPQTMKQLKKESEDSPQETVTK